MAQRSVRMASERVTRVVRVVEHGRATVLIAANVAGVEQGFVVVTSENEEVPKVFLGSLVNACLSIASLQSVPRTATQSDLYRANAALYEELVPTIQRLGVRRIDIDPWKAIAPEDVPAGLRQMAEFNEGTPRKIIRVGP